MKFNKITDRIEGNKIINPASRAYAAANKRNKAKPNAADKLKMKMAKLRIVAAGGQLNKREFPFSVQLTNPKVRKIWQRKRDAAQKEYDLIMAVFFKEAS